MTSIVVTHDMKTAQKVADRIVMLYPLSRLDPDEPQIIFDGTPEEMEHVRDRRVRQFVNGEAGERLLEWEWQLTPETSNMDAETRFAYRVGIVVICAAIILAILVMLFGEGWKSQYRFWRKPRRLPT